MEQATPFFLDQFVGERDKKDLSKLLGVVQECFNILTPTQNNCTLKIMATNGRDQLLVMVPQCHRGERGFMESESRSHWVGDMFRHTMTSEHLGARAFARLIARNHPDEFKLAAKEELDIEPVERMGTIECEAMIQDGNLMFNQFRKVLCKHVEFSTGSGFKMTYRQYEKCRLEMGARSSPEPIFGVYADENGTGEVENCRHYSTSVAQELLYAAESHVLDAGATRELAFP